MARPERAIRLTAESELKVTVVQDTQSLFWRWLDDAAEAVVAVVARFTAPRTVRLIEGEGGQWAVHAGSAGKPADTGGGRLQFNDGRIFGEGAAMLVGRHVDVILRPDYFLFKPLELPTRAGEFIDGIVRAQIDRLTPWSAAQAVFGCTRPADAGGGRIIVTVAATAKSMVAPFVQALAGIGVRSVTVSTSEREADAAITVLQEKLSGIDVRRVRRIMQATLAAVVLSAVLIVGFATIAAGRLQANQDDVARRIAERRSALVAARNQAANPTNAAERALAKRKNQTAASAIVLEVLSQILPDNTYVTELRIEGDKLQLSGITKDAPSLIRLMEQSRHFSHATFFAPTTRAPSDPGDRFHIEAHIVPDFTLRS